MNRERLLGSILSLVKQFVYKASLSKGLSEQASREAGGKIFTFGSYRCVHLRRAKLRRSIRSRADTSCGSFCCDRLGVHGPGADIDLLCVVPKHIVKEDFFGLFRDMLKAFPDIGQITVRRCERA